MAELCEKEVRGIIGHFEKLTDPRCDINRRHLLVDVIVISVLAVIALADGPVAIEVWAKLNQDWLRKYLRLPHGIPSHDTIGRVLQALQPRAFQECFSDWLASLCGPSQPGQRPVVAIDGKTVRRSHDHSKGLGPLHVVSAWASERGITLGQLATEEKSNEITAIPQLVEHLEVKGAIVTIDAAGCQKNIAATIVDGGGDYVLALKGNQEKLYTAVQDLFLDHFEDDFARVPVSRCEEQETSHGRKEHREYFQLDVPQDLAGREQWKGIKTVGIAVRTYESQGEEHSDVRYFISSLKRNVKEFARAVRGHWAIENSCHWSLDMTFREDESRARGRRLADNLSWLRRIALSLLKQHPHKQSIVMKRRMAGWSRDFLMQILTGKAT
jgi:predicted transposase YbfD/YdcC